MSIPFFVDHNGVPMVDHQPPTPEVEAKTPWNMEDLGRVAAIAAERASTKVKPRI
jgi:hypothetical protein